MVLFLKISLSGDVTKYGLDLLLCVHPMCLKLCNPSQFIAIGNISGKGGPCIGGGGAAISCVNTDVKYLLRMSVFIAVSSCSYFAIVI